MCSLCKSAAAVKINLFVYLFIGLFPCLLSVTTLSLIRVLHVQELFSPPGSDSVSSWSAGRLTRSELLRSEPSQLDLSLSSRLRELGIGFHLSSKRFCRGGKRKQRKISVVSGVRAASTTSNDVRRSPGTRSVDSRHLAPVTDVAADVPPRSRTSYSSRGVSFAKLIPVSVQASTATSSPPTQSKIIKVLCFNSQSCRQKASDIHEMILDDGIDILLMTETWLYAQGDKAYIVEMTPRGYVLRSFLEQVRGAEVLPSLFGTLSVTVHLSNACPFSISRPSSFISPAGTCPYRLCACKTPSQQEEQTLQSVVSPGVPRVAHTVCRFPQ